MGNVRMRAEQINYGASNVKVALDDLDPKDLIALSARMDTIEAWKATVKTEEKTGASVEYTNALALAAVSVSAEIEASQDLHGLPFPYVGGAYKNKLPMTVASIKAANTGGTWSGNAYTYRGIVYTLLTDSADNITGINVNGNNTGTTSSDLWIPVNQTIDGIFNGCPSGGSSSTYLQTVWSDQGGHVASDTGSGVSVADIAITSVSIRVRAGVSISDMVFYPMIRLSTESDATFAPYSNICPISGRTSDTISQTDADEQTITVTIVFVDENDDPVTVYGGTLNVTTGVLTITHELITLDGSSDEAWAKSSITTCDIFRYANTDYRFISGTLTNMYPFVNEYDYNQIGYTWKSVYSGVNDAELRIGFSAYGTTTLEQFKTWLASNNLQVYAQLATPQTIQLTPTQLTMLKGYNRLSSDGGGDITVEAYTGAPWGGDD